MLLSCLKSLVEMTIQTSLDEPQPLGLIGGNLPDLNPTHLSNLFSCLPTSQLILLQNPDYLEFHKHPTSFHTPMLLVMLCSCYVA